MEYADGLNYLDQLKDYVESSLSVRQNVQKVEQTENKMEDSLAFKVEGIENDENMEAFELEGNEEFDLFDIVKQEISDEGRIFIIFLKYFVGSH